MEKIIITSTEIVQDLQELHISTVRRLIYDKKIPGELPSEKKSQHIFDRNAYLKWKEDKYPAIRYKYFHRSRYKYMYTREQLQKICEKETGHTIPGKIIQRWAYKDLPIDATKKQVKKWFDSDRGKKLIRFVIKEDHPVNIEKIYSRPCGKDIHHKSNKRCPEYIDCLYNDDCLNFFDALGWHGWEEVKKNNKIIKKG